MRVESFLSRVEAALGEGVAPSELSGKALLGMREWLAEPTHSADLVQLEHLLAEGRLDALLDAFYQVIPFGTGGRRGAVGIGPNRINPTTICSSVQGHAQYLALRFPGVQRSVVVAYDVRRFQDLRGVYAADQPCSLRGLSSRDFAEMAAEVYAGNGIDVWMLPRGSGTWLSTPELSFAIRYLGASGGLNLSASHNPPDDNGAKVYNHHGGQEIPPFDSQLVEEVERVQQIRRALWDDAVAAGRIKSLPQDLHKAYVDLNTGLFVPSSTTAKVVFSPLHGTADTTVGDVLRAAGFEVILEPEQSRADGAFPSVPFAAPNPEVPQSMGKAVELAKDVGADVVMACDPDADRLGVVVRTGEDWRALSGNEIAALVTHARLLESDIGPKSVVMRTEVTSSLVSRIAHAAGVQVVDHLLVGFKYIGDGIRALEEEGEFGNASGTASDFVVGVEESHGVLLTHEIRDKDAAGAALLLAGLASTEKDAGRDLVDTLEALWSTHGRVSNVLVSTVMRGASGRQMIEAIQHSLRSEPPTEIMGRSVVEAIDHQDTSGIHGPIRSSTDHASRNVLSYRLEGDARLTVRPSGTEPKTKVYAELVGQADESESALRQRCLALARAFVGDMLQRVGVEPPSWTLEMSDLMAIEHRLDFAERVLPELLLRIEEQQELSDWLDLALRDYGRDARDLVAPGVAVWCSSFASAEQKAILVRLFSLSGL